MRASLSLLGMYNYDQSIFDDFLLPESVDRETFFFNLLMETAEFEVLIPEPTVLKKAMHFWSKCELPNWQWLIDTQNYDYNPIWNVDVRDTEDLAHLETRDLRGTNYETRDLYGTNNETRDLHGTNNETRDLHGTNNETRNLSGSSNETRNLAGSESGTITDQESGSDTTTNQVVAFNTASGFTDKDKSTTTYGKTNTNTRNLQTTDTGTDNTATTDTGTDNFSSSNTGTDNFVSSNTGTDNFTSSNTGTDKFDTTDSGTIDNKRKNEYYKRGNYGTTTTQEMIKQEQELAKFNVDDYIRQQFMKRFLILVY